MDETTTITLGDAANPYIVQRGDASGLDFALEASTAMMQRVGMCQALIKLSYETGGYVHIRPEFGFMPTLIGTDAKPIFLYRIVKAIDEYIDTDAILNDFPNLNYTQLASAIAFLRKISQLNIRDRDVDDIEDEFLENSPDFIRQLETAFSDKEIVRVLSQPE